MFKNYLTYNLALSFHRSCLILAGLSTGSKDRLMQSSETMIHHFARAIHTIDVQEEAKNLYVTLTCLRDCKETLDFEEVSAEGLHLQFQVLQARLEQLCLAVADKNHGQTRMLG